MTAHTSFSHASQLSWEPARDRLVLTLAPSHHVLLVPRGPVARLHSLRHRPKNPKRPFSFQGACRAHLSGRLTAVQKSPGDRIVELVFGDVSLHLRLTGRGGGLWLRRGQDVIAAYDGPAPSDLPQVPVSSGHPTRARFEREGQESWDDAAARHFGRIESSQRTEERRTQVRRRLKRVMNKSDRLCRALDEDLARAEKAPQLRRAADALAANLHRVPRGQDQVSLEDLEDPSIVHEIRLDPSKPPSAEMERMYSRARRLDKVGERVLEQLDAAEARSRTLLEALNRVELADRDELELLARLVPADGRTRRNQGQAPPWYVWHGPAGEQVLAGKNAQSNRRLTFQVARGDDFWFHIRGVPGAHVLVPMTKGRTPDLQLLLTTAQIVLAQAKVPAGSSADVQYTRARNVKSIRGDKSGRVMVHDEKVLHVTRDPAALVGWVRD